MTRLAFLIVFAVLGAASGATAQTWRAPSEEFRRYGVLTAACNDNGHGGVCLGLACPEGQLQLVSAAGGGGPMNGETSILIGQRRETVTFRWDDRGLDVLGIAASRAPIRAAVVEAIASTPRVVLRSNGVGSPLTHRFATRNLAREWQRVRASCPG